MILLDTRFEEDFAGRTLPFGSLAADAYAEIAVAPCRSGMDVVDDLGLALVFILGLNDALAVLQLMQPMEPCLAPVGQMGWPEQDGAVCS